MRHRSDISYVWSSLARTYDRVAGLLGSEAPAYLAYPELAPNPAFSPRHLETIEVDFYCRDRAYRARLADAIRRYRVGLVVYMNAPAVETPRSMLRRWGVRTLNSEQDQLQPNPRQSRLRRWVKWVLRSGLGVGLHDMHLAVSQHGRGYLREFAGFPASRLVTVANGVDPAQYSPGPSPSPEELGLPRTDSYAVGVFQARPEKRGDFLLEVARQVFARRPQLSLTFVHVGGGPCAAAWQARASAWGLAERFHFVPVQRNTAPFHRLATLLIHAAERENLPFAVLEAMATGKPVVASRIPATDELIRDGETGFLLDLQDGEGFAAALLRLIDDPNLCHTLGQAGRDCVLRHYALETQARRLSQVIQEQLSQSRCGAA